MTKRTQRRGPGRPATLPVTSGPLVRQLFDRAEREGWTIKDLGGQSGYDAQTIGGWKKQSMPKLQSVSDVGAVIGMSLRWVIEPDDRTVQVIAESGESKTYRLIEE